ncbi:hypothetical protein [Kribbella sp. CA-247076]|uniref:hypothetical protein n=1 Tax=Kribbella sp. CA-247076 TaxID=3239941 RepID=UPI003D917DDE
MLGPTTDSRIYLLDADERRVVPGGPAVVGPDGVREEIPALAFEAVQHVLAAMRDGRGVKITPLRPELPIDEAADAIGMGRDDLRKNVANGAIPFRSTQYVDWVKLADVIEWDNRRYAEQQAALDELMGGDPTNDDEQR